MLLRLSLCSSVKPKLFIPERPYFARSSAAATATIKTTPIKLHRPPPPPPPPKLSLLDKVANLLNRKQVPEGLTEFMMVRNGKEIPSYSLCIRLLQAIIEVPKFHALAIEILRSMHTTWKHPVNQTAFHLTLEALSRANQPNLQQGVVERMRRAGFPPTAETYSLLMLAYCRPGEKLPRSHPFYSYMQEAIRLVQTPTEQNLVLERTIAVALRSSQTSAAEEIVLWITHASLTVQAHGVVQGLLETAGNALELQPTLHLLDHIRIPLSEMAMLALFRLQAAVDPSKLPDLYASMSVPLSPEGCAELIELAGSSQLAESLEEALREQESTWTKEIFNALIRVYGANGQHRRVDQLLEKMQQLSILSDRATLLAAVGSAPSLEVGRARLSQIQSSSPPSLPSVSDISLAMLLLCERLGDSVTAASVWGSLARPRKPHFQSFLSVLSKAGDYGMMRQCFEGVKGLQPGPEIFDAMIRYCTDPEHMRWILKQVQDARVNFSDLKQISQMLSVLAGDGMLKEVEHIILLLTDNGRARPSLQQSEQLIRAAWKSGKQAAAQQYLLDAAAEMPTPSVEVYNVLLRCCLLVGAKQRFRKIVEDLLWHQIKPNEETRKLIAQAQ